MMNKTYVHMSELTTAKYFNLLQDNLGMDGAFLGLASNKDASGQDKNRIAKVIIITRIQMQQFVKKPLEEYNARCNYLLPQLYLFPNLTEH